MSCYVILRGPLGVGKTTISQALAKSIGAVVISIDEIADKEWDGGSVQLYVRANGVAAERARRALARDVPVVFDGCFYWKTQVRDLERRLDFPHVVFTLKAPLSVCVRRDAGRDVVHGTEAAEQVYRKVTRFEYGVLINATRGVSTSVREIRTHLPSGEAPSRDRWSRAEIGRAWRSLKSRSCDAPCQQFGTGARVFGIEDTHAVEGRFGHARTGRLPLARVSPRRFGQMYRFQTYSTQKLVTRITQKATPKAPREKLYSPERLIAPATASAGMPMPSTQQ